ncbi:MAG: glutamate--tRNA ligase [Acidobacteriia bacterium]|nr:glutamate--tRNA ligase [Terriglobia bacterium]
MSSHAAKSGEVRVRFAPSPTGYLHVGGARTALFDWLFARHYGGKFILRIEDTDVERSSPEMVEEILEGMRWLGLDWDEGPFFQSERTEHYRKAARELLESGHAYYCYCTPESLKERRDLAMKEKRNYKYEGTCRRLTSAQIEVNEGRGLPRAVRFKVPESGTVEISDHVFGKIEVAHEQIEDFVLLNSKNHPTYHLSVVVDDMEMRITHVVRGADHVSNTPKQILLYRAFGAEIPEFAHLPLILGPDKAKLSKRHGTTSVTAYRDMGYLPEAFRNFLALLGWSPGDNTEIMSTDELIERFSLDKINQSNAVFDIQKLDWLNRQYIGASTAERLAPMVQKALESKHLWRDEFNEAEREYFFATIDMLKSRMHSINDFAESGQAFFTDVYEIDEAAAKKNLKDPALKELMPLLASRLKAHDVFSLESSEQALRALAEEKQVKAGLLINAARVLLTGRAVGPPLFHIMVQLGRERTATRLERISTLTFHQ